MTAIDTGPAHATLNQTGGRDYQHPPAWEGKIPGATGEPVPSVTTILKGIGSNEGLIKWAGREAATCAIEEHANWSQMPTEQAHAYIASAHTRKRDSAADRGTSVHTIAEKLARGDKISNIERMVFGGYVDALEHWWVEHKPQPVAIEATCWNLTRGYAGTADLIAKLKGVRGLVVLDWKTSKGIYSEVGAQLAAYADAPFYTEGTSTTAVAMPAIRRGFVVRLVADGTWEMREADLSVGRELFAAALTVKKLNLVSKVYPTKKVKGMASVESMAGALRARVEWIAQHNEIALGALAAAWPAGVLPFKAGGPRTVSECRELESIVARIEMEYGIPF